MEPFSNLFPPADKAAWRAQVQKDLKDASAPDSLRWQTDLSGRTGALTLEPYYTAEDMAALPLSAIQAAQKQSPGWLNAPSYPLTADPKADNGILRNALSNGADALVLTLPEQPDLPKLLDGIKLSDTPIYFRLRGDGVELLTKLRQIAPYQLRGGLLFPSEATDSLQPTILTADSPHFCTVSVNGQRYHNAGGNATQELAFSLAELAHHYDYLTDGGLAIDQLIPKTMVSLSVGTSYFTEIAKLRALRVLLTRFLSCYSPTADHQPFIHCQSSLYYQAAATPYTNLLRATTEAMSAVIGGCDALTVLPYDVVSDEPGFSPDRDFTSRIARNVSTLLKEESYLDKVADPSAGSYYVEHLTHELAEVAWALFLDVEQRGGYAAANAERGFIPGELAKTHQARVEAVEAGRVLVGVTKFRHDEPGDDPEKDKRLTGPLAQRTERLAQSFE